MNSDRKPFYEMVAEKLIQQLGEGAAPWQKPWAPGESRTLLPINPTTGKRYKGINALHLMSEGREDQRWMTYKQAAAAGAQVRKGERGTQIQYWQFTEEQPKLNAGGKRVVDSDGTSIKIQCQLERPRVFFATVFNAGQIDGLPAPALRQERSWNAIERAEHILLSSGAVISHSEQDRAFYRLVSDSIHLPGKHCFPTADNYYATALHELGHWTGHPSRLARDLAHPFGSDGYAREELRAEIASMMLGDQLGIGHDPSQHAAYVGSWIKILQNNPLEIFRAAADAEKIHDYALDLELQQVQVQVAHPALAAFEITEDFMDETQEINTNIPGAERAEGWIISRLNTRDIARAVDQATSTQLAGMQEALTEMSPLSNENPLWQRHELPADVDALRKEIDSAAQLIALRQGDWPVTSAWQELCTGDLHGPASRARRETLDSASQQALGCLLPMGWTGDAWTQMDIPKESGQSLETTPVQPSDTRTISWGVFGLDGQGTAVRLTENQTEVEAAGLLERLKWIAAHTMTNEYEKAARFARMNEERVRRDPDRTEEDVVFAKEIRKSAEFVATVEDEQFKQEIKVRELELSQLRTDSDSASLALPENVTDKMMISVPYSEKEQAKAIGAKWDRQAQSWYVPGGVDATPFNKWATAAVKTGAGEAQQISGTLDSQLALAASEGRHYLAVPYRDRNLAKDAGAEWDRKTKSWYAGPAADMARLARWNPDNVPGQQDPAMTPREEFSDTLQSVGCVVSGEHPIMDGKTHRISVLGEKFSKNSGSGFYVGHLDGQPAGYVKNNKTGEDLTWKSKGYALDAAAKALLSAAAASKLQAREAELALRHKQAAERVEKQMTELMPCSQPTAYMIAKGIEVHPGALTDQEGKKTYLPVMDVDGKQWSLQYIQEDGTKRFAKNSRKEGCFHVVGGMNALDRAPALVISEGYATAAQLSQALGYATVSAFDSGNLAAVARALHKKFHDKPVIIAGDDDRHLEMTYGVNPGRTKAEAAAALVGGKVWLPIFAPEENSFPAAVSPVTPTKFSEHQKTGKALSAEQQAALARMKQFTDFNDLATKSTLGEDALRRQAHFFVENVIGKHVVKSLEQVQRRRQEYEIQQPRVMIFS